MKTVSLIIAAAFIIPTAHAAKAEVQLQPHRAIYELSLAAGSRSSTVGAVSGAVFYEFTESCEGWTVNNRTIFRTLYDEGMERTSDSTYSSWESRDSSEYRFNVQTQVNGQPAPTIKGEADTTSTGGLANFREPAPQTLSLTRGTLFPSQHIKAMIRAAQAGEQFLLADVFDGFAADSPYFSINAFLGPVRQPDPNAKPGLDVESWKMRLALFDKASNSEQPSFELGIRYFANGIAAEVVQDFGDQKIDMKLKEIELLPRPKC